MKKSWKTLLSDTRIHTNLDDDNRTSFERDFDKIIFSSYFRRLQNKTQLFPLPKSDKIHSRLTHSLEVASVGRSLGNSLVKFLKENAVIEKNEEELILNIPTIVAAACLFHDIGNPAFGHSGEKAISRYFKINHDKLINLGISRSLVEELCKFEGNAQAFRIITFEKDFNLTYAVIATFMKYPRGFSNKKSVFKKYGVTQYEFLQFKRIFDCLNLKNSNNKYIRHPLAFLVEAADDICYKIIDLEDAYKIKLIDYDTIKSILSRIIECDTRTFNVEILESIELESYKVSYLRALAIKSLVSLSINKFTKHYDEIMSGEYKNLLDKNQKLVGLIDKLEDENDMATIFEDLQKVIEERAYDFEPVLKIELTGFDILYYFLEIFIESIIYAYKKKNWKISDVVEVNEAFFEKLVKIIPKDYIYLEETIDKAVLKIVDFVSGMTDIHAIKLYKKIKGIDLLR